MKQVNETRGHTKIRYAENLFTTKLNEGWQLVEGVLIGLTTNITEKPRSPF